VETQCPDILHGLGHMLACINEKIAIPLQVPSIVQPSCSSQNFVFTQCNTASGGVESVAVRVFHWIEGTTLSRVKPDLPLMVQLGGGIGEVWRALDGFTHPSFKRQHLWDVRQLALSRPLLSYVDCPQVRACIEAVHVQFSQVLAVSEQLPWSVIMADCNDANVIVTDAADAEAVVRVEGLIDFSDAVYTWSVNEVAIAMAYALLTSYGKEQPYKVPNLHTYTSTPTPTHIYLHTYTYTPTPNTYIPTQPNTHTYTPIHLHT
jgi:Ser/Thr protein kinase RdoA (MazF antagonist)